MLACGGLDLLQILKVIVFVAKANKPLFVFSITYSFITSTLYSSSSLKFVAENENENSYLEDKRIMERKKVRCRNKTAVIMVSEGQEQGFWPERRVQGVQESFKVHIFCYFLHGYLGHINILDYFQLLSLLNTKIMIVQSFKVLHFFPYLISTVSLNFQLISLLPC